MVKARAYPFFSGRVPAVMPRGYRPAPCRVRAGRFVSMSN